ncbi:thiamine pyrophosphate-dependent enzyme [Caldicellulosiruptor naganoensis]|uniref:Thiamine pyrophosphate-dependent enzyme n=1 Tax=Caldicellulosiruptor naganoensis TaxID=29324 RepID=A0ABY7BDM5_9FIRM|nr:thiamine pyrophosphate-dependent enzyme [Caldicellulosiruptor naganoensis]WAM30934.1 thiamine pyrophosphate-dependent enzyme [Caldicellulosiruptor naganoensis]
MKLRKPECLTAESMHYCPGCGHGIIHRLIAEVIDEDYKDHKIVGVAPVGCAVFIYDYFNFDFVAAAHGRATAAATGVKRCIPDALVFSYQGDGDIAAIGTSEVVHAAARGENFTAIFVNNGVYAMTGGQMAPTTIPGQVTVSSPYGRDPKVQGYHIKLCEMLIPLDGVAFVARTSIHNLKNIELTKKAIKRAFEVQMNKEGFSIIEVLSNCPTNWGMTPAESMKRIENEVLKYYNLGIFKDKGRGI